jgi:hypothetical protein
VTRPELIVRGRTWRIEPARRWRWALLAAAVLGAVGCGDDGAAVAVDGAAIDAAIDGPMIDAPIDAAVDAAIDAGFVEPERLSQTGLYANIATKTLAPGVTAFTPRWQLWSDEAVKQRYIWLPPGAQIDTSSMDVWSFPVGTKVWKEFVRGGRRIETRLLQKIGPTDDYTDWFMVSFQWDAAETEAMAVPDGVPDDVGHDDIPSRSGCRICHRDIRTGSVVLGFSALQLDATPAIAGQPSMASLVAAGRLSAPPTGAMPYFPLPTGSAVTEAAFGYLHANCGNCHNAASEVHDQVPIELRLPVALTTWAATPSYATTVDRPLGAGAAGATAVVEPGVPATSSVYLRMTSGGSIKMPPLGREVIDPTGSELVRAWIASLPPTP